MCVARICPVHFAFRANSFLVSWGQEATCLRQTTPMLRWPWPSLPGAASTSTMVLAPGSHLPLSTGPAARGQAQPCHSGRDPGCAEWRGQTDRVSSTHSQAVQCAEEVPGPRTCKREHSSTQSSAAAWKPSRLAWFVLNMFIIPVFNLKVDYAVNRI